MPDSRTQVMSDALNVTPPTDAARRAKPGTDMAGLMLEPARSVLLASSRLEAPMSAIPVSLVLDG